MTTQQTPRNITPLKSSIVPSRTNFLENDLGQFGVVDGILMYPKSETSVKFETPQDSRAVIPTSENEATSTEDLSFKQEPARRGVCEFIVQHYRISFALAFGVELLAGVLTLVLYLDHYKIFPVDFRGVPLSIRTDKSYLRYLAFDKLSDQPSIMPAEADRVRFIWRSRVMDQLEVVYEGKNVLTRECLQAIKRLEEELTSSKLWADWSLTDIDSNVLPPTSLLRFFDGTVDTSFNDSTLTNITEILANAYTKPWYREKIDVLIAKDAVLKLTEIKSTLTRSVFYIGVRPTSSMFVTDFWAEAFGNRLKKLSLDGLAGMRVMYYTLSLFVDDTIKQVEKDLKLAIGSFLFILIFVFIQTGSIFITTIGLFGILSSFLWTNYIYRVILDYRYFGIFHAMSIFIILGIGSDDLFVFYDMWRLTALMDLSSSEERFSFCYRHATMSMLITSVTTAAAFASNIFTPLFGVYTFALFSAMLVMINYLSAIIFFPLGVLFYHKDIEPCQWPWQALCGSKEGTKKKVKPNIIIRFFRNVFFNFVTHFVMRWFFIVTCTCIAVTLSCVAYQLDISKRDVQYYRNGLNYQDVKELQLNGFKTQLDDTRIKVNILFGVKEQDLSTCEDHAYKCEGTFNFDDSLDLNPVPAQLALQAACRLLKNTSAQGNEDLHVVRDKRTGLIQTTCILDNMETFFTQQAAMLSPPNATINLRLPITGIKFLPLARLRTDLYYPDILNGNFYRFFETAAYYWLTNGHRGNPRTGENYNQDLLLSKNLGLSYFSDDIRPLVTGKGFYGTRLRFLKIEFLTDLFLGATNFRDGLLAHDAWENLTNTLMSALPPSVQGFQVSTKNEWHLFKVSQSLQQSAVRGIALGGVMAFIVLTIATSNVILSFLATINILLVVGSFAGCIKLLGWSISIIESINLSLVTGLSVDYVVHFSESYHHAPHEDRKRRVRDMLEHMGVSVLSGAFTTAGAALFMVGAQIYFFYQFGVFIIITILFSLFYCLFWFTPLLSVIGPEGEVGSMVPVYRYIVQIMTLLLKRFENSIQEQKKLSYSRSMSHQFFQERSEPMTGDSFDTGSEIMAKYQNVLMKASTK